MRILGVLLTTALCIATMGCAHYAGAGDLIIASSLDANGVETWSLDANGVECSRVISTLERTGAPVYGAGAGFRRVTLRLEGSLGEVSRQACQACSGYCLTSTHP